MIMPCWVAAILCLYIFAFFLTYLPFDIYVLGGISGISSIGYFLLIPLSKVFNFMKTQILSLILVCLFLIITFMDLGVNIYFYTILIILLRAFICLLYGNLFVNHLELFDTTFLVKSYGICNIVSRFV